ncbi:MAG: U32 family peptidase [Bacteroidales bacterium]|jgi:putative protease
MEYIELLSPAKNLEIGKAAIETGADAVYIGAESFGARAAAGNNLEEIEELVNYAHIFNAKVYVTVNTVLFDNELKAVEELINRLYNIGVDALIIQDMGILEMNLPPIPLHASTQMHNLSKEKVDFLSKIGLKRVVLPRELSIDGIAEIHKEVPEIEIESFVHGALCNGLSGQCYLSYELTKRSGNRGECSQPCRSRYDLVNAQGKILVKNKHLLSTKDLNASSYISQMIDSGVRSFKIEGRLKDLDYVKNVTAYYSQEINKYIDSRRGVLNTPSQYSRSSIGKSEISFTPDVERSFNRGFTSFNLQGKKDKIGDLDTAKAIGKYIGKVADVNLSGRSHNFIQISTKEEIVNGDGLCFFNKNGELEGFLVNKVEPNPEQSLVNIIPNKNIDIRILTKIYRNFDLQFTKQVEQDSSKRKIGIDFELSETPNGFILKAKDETGLEVEERIETEKQLAKNTENYDENLLKQIDKLGNSFFYLKNFTNTSTQKYFLPSSVINSLRRICCDKLIALRKESYKRKESKFEKTDYPYISKQLDYNGNVVNEKAKEFYLRHGVEEIVYGVEKTNKTKDIVLMRSKNCIRFALGQCIIKDKQTPDFDQELFLKDNNRTYKLSFDCKNCFMDIQSLEK